MNQEILGLFTKRSLFRGSFLFLIFFVFPLTVNQITSCVTFFESQCSTTALYVVIFILMIPYLFVTTLIDGLVPDIFGTTFNIIVAGIILYISFVVLCTLFDDLISKKWKRKP